MAETEATNRGLPDLVLDIDNVDDDNSENALPLKESSGFIPPGSSKTPKRTTENSSATSPQQMNKTNSKQTYLSSDEQRAPKAESKVTPRRTQLNPVKGPSKLKPVPQSSTRPCQQHSFLTDITDVRQMEQGLLQLLDDFHSGKLQAFGKDCTFEKMEQVREQQERLARLHFDLNAQQEIYGPQSEDGRRMGRENLSKLIENLQQLSLSIEQLQTSSPGVQTDV